MRFAVVAAVLAAITWVAPAAAQQKKIQCWTDENGQRMCGDRVPPEYAGQKREVVKGGRVVETVKAARTPEEIAEAKREKQKAEDAQRQADYDRALLETYRTSKDIESMRDERILMIDGRRGVIEKNAANTDKTLVDLKARADKLTAEGKKVDDKLTKQIRQFERDQRQNEKSLERNRTERAEIERKFNSDLERYCALRGCKIEPRAAEAPAAVPATPADPGAAPATPADPAPAEGAPAAQPTPAPPKG
jgi:hypothetical protein